MELWDRVYVLCGMMCEEDRDVIVVDYCKSIFVVFVEVVVYVFDKSQGLYFFFGLFFLGFDLESGFFFWVLDFIVQVVYEVG